MAFDWVKFLQQNDVPYVESGPNVNARQVGIKCPMCGQSDPSEHMALPRQGGWWSCRRTRSHGGSTPHQLIMLLLRCSYEAAKGFVGDQAPSRDPDASFAEQMKKLVGGRVVTTDAEPESVVFPTDFRPLTNRGLGKRFWDYMRGRHYTDAQLDELSRVYGLQYATKGRYGYRVIVPVYAKTGLMSWTGRTIGDRDMVRYKSLSVMDYPDQDPPPVLANIHDLLLNEDNLEKGGEVLAVAEGPFDGMRLDYFGYPHLRGTCFFGKSVSRRQVSKLINLGRHYHRKWVLLDEDAKIDALAVQSQLERGGFRIRYMQGGKDPAALRQDEINELISSL